MAHSAIPLALLFLEGCVAPPYPTSGDETRTRAKADGSAGSGLLDREVIEVLASRSDDGGWYSRLMGATHGPALSVLATNELGVRSPDVYREDRDLVEGLLETANSDGGFPTYVTARSVKSSSKLVLLALESFLRNQSSTLTRETSFRSRVEAAADAARTFINGRAVPDEYTFHGLLPELLDHSGRYPSSTQSTTSWITFAQWTSALGAELSTLPAQMGAATSLRHFLPAAGILWELLRWQIDSGEMIGERPNIDFAGSGFAALEQQILKSQNEDGGWFYMCGATALNLIALQRLRPHVYTPDHAVVAGGIAALRKYRHRGPSGRISTSWARGDIWDTATAVEFLALAAPDRLITDRLAEGLLDWFVRWQTAEGRWAFASNADAPDNDTTAYVLSSMLKLQRLIDSGMRRPFERPGHIASHIALAIRALLREQYKGGDLDGGWAGYTTGSAGRPWAFLGGDGRCDPLRATLVSGLEPDVTARAYEALTLARASGLFDEQAELRKDIRHALGRAERYFQRKQDRTNGSWWSRWFVGYLHTPFFLFRALRLGAVEEPGGSRFSKRWLRRGRGFLVGSHRGRGWGESLEADVDPTRAGRGGPITPVQTAFALAAMIASSPTNDLREDPHHDKILASIDYLEQSLLSAAEEEEPPRYTITPCSAYYTNPLLTRLYVAYTLAYARRAYAEGVDAATGVAGVP